jgi:hypothetical protein
VMVISRWRQSTALCGYGNLRNSAKAADASGRARPAPTVVERRREPIAGIWAFFSCAQEPQLIAAYALEIVDTVTF